MKIIWTFTLLMIPGKNLNSQTEEKDKWIHSGRFSLFDDTTAAVFSVTFRDLSEQDSGTYQCGVDRTTAKDSYTEVKMNVRKGENGQRGSCFTEGFVHISVVYNIVTLKTENVFVFCLLTVFSDTCSDKKRNLKSRP
uniref:Ig-like domain-containing protein n=1 Tax=Sinocyclocheilus anshuiensis TaxID=1608454 RepID=A0A671NKH3_9TELE